MYNVFGFQNELYSILIWTKVIKVNHKKAIQIIGNIFKKITKFALHFWG